MPIQDQRPCVCRLIPLAKRWCTVPRWRPRRWPSNKLQLEPLEPRQLLAASPIISEFLARNDGGLRDGDGNSPDWIELFNAGDAAIDLAGYHLTDSTDDLDQWTFPSVRLDPGDYLVVFASAQDRNDYVDPAGYLHTNFALRQSGDYLALVDPAGMVVSHYGTATANFPAQLPNVSFGRAQRLELVNPTSQTTYLVPLDDRVSQNWTQPDFDAAASGFAQGTASLGFETRPSNRTNFVGQFQTALPEGAHAIYARMEFELPNAAAIANLSMRLKYDNGFVAYLNGAPVAQENAPENPGWFSTAADSSRSDEEALQFVDWNLTDHVDALVNGKNVLAIHAMNHPADNSDMLLVAELSASASDLLAAIGQPTRIGYMPTPTPGAPNVSNDEVFAGFVADTRFSVDRGFYDAPVTVEITTQTPGAQIRYTTDGSAPGPTHGAVYSAPITIRRTTPLRAAAFRPDFLPSNVDTQTYLFLDNVLTQDGQGLPETWGTFSFGSTEADIGAPVPANYEVDPKVVNDPRYRDTLKNDLRALPTLSVVMNPDDLWNPNRGIYTHPLEEGIEWERPGSAELIAPDGQTLFQIDAGIRIHGGFGRRPEATAKHSLRLLFKGEYGATKFVYPWFGQDQVDRFDTIVLRANYNYSWARGNRTGTQTGKDYTLVTDRWGSVTQQQMGGLAPNGTFVHLYINGLYWGVYNPTERPDASFMAEHLGGDKEDYDVLTQDGVMDGDNQAWNELGRGLLRQRPVDYNAVKEVVDITNYIDYMILNQFGGNGDWPQNNWYVSRKREPGAKWHFHAWDTEFFFINLNENRISGLPNEGPGQIFNPLRNNDEFRLLFADRIHRHLFNDGALSPQANIARLNTLAEPLDRAVVGESARWGDAWMNQVSPPRTRDDDWLPRLEVLRTVYFPQRNDIVIAQYRRVELYPQTDAPEFNQHGGTVPAGFQLSISNPGGAGTVYYTTDGSDPRAGDGSVAPQAIAFAGAPILLKVSPLVKARVLNGAEWSALTEASFSTTDAPSPEPITPLAGDANRDGRFDQLDLVLVLQGGKYATGKPAGWSEGDWNGDGIFDSKDIVAALATGRFLASPEAALSAGRVSTSTGSGTGSAIEDPIEQQLALDDWFAQMASR